MDVGACILIRIFLLVFLEKAFVPLFNMCFLINFVLFLVPQGGYVYIVVIKPRTECFTDTVTNSRCFHKFWHIKLSRCAKEILLSYMRPRTLTFIEVRILAYVILAWSGRFLPHLDYLLGHVFLIVYYESRLQLFIFEPLEEINIYIFILLYIKLLKLFLKVVQI